MKTKVDFERFNIRSNRPVGHHNPWNRHRLNVLNCRLWLHCGGRVCSLFPPCFVLLPVFVCVRGVCCEARPVKRHSRTSQTKSIWPWFVPGWGRFFSSIVFLDCQGLRMPPSSLSATTCLSYMVFFLWYTQYNNIFFLSSSLIFRVAFSLCYFNIFLGF